MEWRHRGQWVGDGAGAAGQRPARQPPGLFPEQHGGAQRSGALAPSTLAPSRPLPPSLPVQDAISYFESVAALDPLDADAAAGLERARAELAALREARRVAQAAQQWQQP